MVQVREEKEITFDEKGTSIVISFAGTPTNDVLDKAVEYLKNQKSVAILTMDEFLDKLALVWPKMSYEQRQALASKVVANQ